LKTVPYGSNHEEGGTVCGATNDRVLGRLIETELLPSEALIVDDPVDIIDLSLKKMHNGPDHSVVAVAICCISRRITAADYLDLQFLLAPLIRRRAPPKYFPPA